MQNVWFVMVKKILNILIHLAYIFKNFFDLYFLGSARINQFYQHWVNFHMIPWLGPTAQEQNIYDQIYFCAPC